MKIYILACHNYDGIDVEGVYSTREKALEAIRYHENLREEAIEEYELDPPNVGEIYEDYFYCNVKPSESVTKMWGDSCKIRPSEFVPFKFVISHRETLDHTQGFGKTMEEAEANARHAQTLLHPVWKVHVEDGHNCDHRFRIPHPSACTSKFFGTYAIHEDFNVAKIAVMEYQATRKLSPFLTVC